MAGVKGRSGGHNKKSIADLKAAGTFRPDRHGGLEDPEHQEGTPQPPRPLEGIALEEWNRMIALIDPRVLTQEKYQVIYQVAKTFAAVELLDGKTKTYEDRIAQLHASMLETKDIELLIQAQTTIAKYEQMVQTNFTQVRGYRSLMLRHLVELGITPASAARVKLPKRDEKPPSKLIAFLGGKAKA